MHVFVCVPPTATPTSSKVLLLRESVFSPIILQPLAVTLTPHTLSTTHSTPHTTNLHQSTGHTVTAAQPNSAQTHSQHALYMYLHM